MESIRQGACYDLIYLDIEMPMVNGISAAELIRQMEVPALFIYVSSHENYAVEMSVTEPFRFVRKPIDERIFHEFFITLRARTESCISIHLKMDLLFQMIQRTNSMGK